MLDDNLTQTARRQHGLLSRAQVLQYGGNDNSIRHRVRTGRWQRVLPGVYATFSGRLTPVQRERASLLFAGDDAQLAGLSACRRYGLRYLPRHDGKVHVLVPHRQQAASTAFVVIHRTRRMPLPCYVGGLPTCSPPRAVIDVCRQLKSLQDIRALMADAVNRRLARVKDLEAELKAGCSAGSALPRQALADVAIGCRSAPECELRDLFRRSKLLPEPLWNAWLTDDSGQFLGCPDAYLPEALLAIEVNSREWHMEGDTFEGTMQRASKFAAAGILVLPVSPSRIRRDGEAFLHEVENAYLRRLRRS